MYALQRILRHATLADPCFRYLLPTGELRLHESQRNESYRVRLRTEGRG